MTDSFFLSRPGLVNALGTDTEAVARGLFSGDTSGMAGTDVWLAGRSTVVGAVRDLGEGPAPDWQGRDTWAEPAHRSRNNRLLLAAAGQVAREIEAARERHGPARVGVVIGTSTSGIAEGEAALAARLRGTAPAPDYRYAQQELGAPARFLAHHFGLRGPAFCVSTACTSSAKAFASARQLLRLGVCDAVVVGGADSLSRLTVGGFAALESLALGRCNPMSVNRRGINIGEGAAVFVLSREPGEVRLTGIGESSDAWHVSAPDPSGRGAIAAMREALAEAALAPADIGYVNLHATATPKNDEMESLAVATVFGVDTPTSGTKPLVGHTLGTAGATELAFCWLALTRQQLPPHVFDGERDPALAPIRLAEGGAPARRLVHVASNSFAFGGSNAVLVASAG